jgi:hypothetical protein
MMISLQLRAGVADTSVLITGSGVLAHVPVVQGFVIAVFLPVGRRERAYRELT